jgi:hypothetical protein
MKPSVVVPSKKKPYQSPKLLIYGNLTEMTRAAKNRGGLDGATRGPRRTG